MKNNYKLILLILCFTISSTIYSQERNLQQGKALKIVSKLDRNKTPLTTNNKNKNAKSGKTINSSSKLNPNQSRLIYCEPSFNSCSSDYINKIIFAGINNDSECEIGLSDYTDQIGLVKTGDTYTISIRNQALSSQNVFLFIDWNQNGVLNDTGEVYTIAANVSNNGPHTKEISIPQDAVLGETRMRVILQWNNTSPNPCIVYSIGEAEDYTLNVVDEIPNTPADCTQFIPADDNDSGYFFGGVNNQKLAIDIDILAEASFEINSIKIQTIDQASTFDVIFYEDDNNLPGDPIVTLDDVNIAAEEYLGEDANYTFYRYTLDISADNVLFEGQQQGIKVWMEIISDATGWNNSNYAKLGNFAAFLNSNTNGWEISEDEFVYELIGDCTGNQIQDIPNNACEYAIPLTCGIQITGTTVGAEDFGGNLSPDVFYTYTGNGEEENIALSMCIGTDYDTLIRVFTDCSLANEITFNNNFCSLQSVVNFTSDGVSTYYIMIEGGWPDDMGDFTLYASCSSIPSQNDIPSQAISLTCGDRVLGNTVNASNTAGNAAGDVFYSYTGQGVAEDITVSLCSAFTSYDTEIRVYDSLDLNNEIAFADDSCGLFSQLIFTSDGVSTYYIMIEGSGSEEGNFSLHLSCWDNTPYCSPLYFVYVEPITNVEIADISNRSSADVSSAPHEVFTDITGNLQQGEAYDITLEGYTGDDGEWENFFTVFIDWNKNNVFDDAGEMFEIGSIFNSTGNDGNQLIGSITVPIDAELGTTVMRVLKHFNEFATDPCANYGYGQVEDYTINIESVLGNEDISKNLFRYYPNPIEETLNIESEVLLKDIIIYDISGKVIYMATPNLEKVQLDLSFLASGIYLAKVVTETEVQTIKIIKN